MNQWISLVINRPSFSTITPFLFHKRRALSEIRLNCLTRGSLVGPTTEVLKQASVQIEYKKRGSKIRDDKIEN